MHMREAARARCAACFGAVVLGLCCPAIGATQNSEPAATAPALQATPTDPTVEPSGPDSGPQEPGPAPVQQLPSPAGALVAAPPGSQPNAAGTASEPSPAAATASLQPAESSAAAAEGQLPPTASASERGASAFIRRNQEARLQRATPTSVGGLAEINYELAPPNNGERARADVDLGRVVLYVAHTFSDQLRFNAGVELTHSVASSKGAGEIGMEQAYLDYVLSDAVGLRAGVVLVPFGIINQWHEPATYLSVQRPQLDIRIIPSTWREAGVGIFGRPTTALRYELYVISGLDPLGFSTEEGLKGGAQNVSLANTKAPTVVGRLEVDPVPELQVGGSAYFSAAGRNIRPRLFEGSSTGRSLDPLVPVVGLSADAVLVAAGAEARAQFTWFSVGDTDQLRVAENQTDTLVAPDVGSSLLGTYVEFGYDVLHGAGTDHQLLPFVRFERTDTVASIKGRASTPQDEALGVTSFVSGASWRPIADIAIKIDARLDNPDGPTKTAVILGGGGGLSF